MLQTDGLGKLIVERIIFYINVAYYSQYLEHGQKRPVIYFQLFSILIQHQRIFVTK